MAYGDYSTTDRSSTFDRINAPSIAGDNTTSPISPSTNTGSPGISAETFGKSKTKTPDKTKTSDSSPSRWSGFGLTDSGFGKNVNTDGGVSGSVGVGGFNYSNPNDKNEVGSRKRSDGWGISGSFKW